jgi:3-dehydroquinate dehydratase I
MAQMQRGIPLNRANVVGVIHQPAGFAAAGRTPVDAVEVRVDALPGPPDVQRLAALTQPAIVTIRRHDEGGCLPLPDAVRAELFAEYLPVAAAMDIEAGSLGSLAETVEAARRQRRLVIGSFHDFSGTPSLARLRAVARRALDSGADVVKVATVTETPSDVATLLRFLEENPGRCAVMGMGTLGRASRLLLAKAGSVLNYGWLARPQVPGQWSAAELARLLARA